jgi:hypothetical protein
MEFEKSWPFVFLHGVIAVFMLFLQQHGFCFFYISVVSFYYACRIIYDVFQDESDSKWGKMVFWSMVVSIPLSLGSETFYILWFINPYPLTLLSILHLIYLQLYFLPIFFYGIIISVHIFMLLKWLLDYYTEHSQCFNDYKEMQKQIEKNIRWEAERTQTILFNKIQTIQKTSDTLACRNTQMEKDLQNLKEILANEQKQKAIERRKYEELEKKQEQARKSCRNILISTQALIHPIDDEIYQLQHSSYATNLIEEEISKLRQIKDGVTNEINNIINAFTLLEHV